MTRLPALSFSKTLIQNQQTEKTLHSLLCYDLIITKLGSSKMFHELDQVLLQLKSDTRIVPTEILFCNVINYFGRRRLPTCALHVFVEMPQYRCQRTVKEALKMKHDMLKVYGVCPTVHTYASLIKALCQIGELSLAFKLKEEAYEGKIKVDSAIYSTLISSLIKAGRSDEVSGILEEMREKGCEPDTVTYNVLINGFCVENDLESAYRVLDEMVEKAVKPDFEEAAVVLDEMMFKGYKPRRDRLEIFLQRLCESGKLEILGKVISSLSKGNAVDADSLLDHFSCKVSVAVLGGEDMKLNLLLFKTEEEPEFFLHRLLLLSAQYFSSLSIFLNSFIHCQTSGVNLGVKMVEKKKSVLYHYPCHDCVFAALAAHLYFSANSIPSLFFPKHSLLSNHNQPASSSRNQSSLSS
ncbi:hypothetical protein F2Q69_00044402 [Brassica cretica]|uniref:Pentacotripeptide-repeat region of PRORP domain-containing protein n=1 Tax=Brassica cretica TaxID=69181 RepID=A0A8S9NA15_BRACR|nr:hypothetical protein F2Q69_00044402 [Brassica cretica]